MQRLLQTSTACNSHAVDNKSQQQQQNLNAGKDMKNDIMNSEMKSCSGKSLATNDA